MRPSYRRLIDYRNFVQCELHQGSGVAELIAAMAAGWNAKLIVETWSQGGRIATSIGLATAAKHTGGRHVCIVPDNRSRVAYIKAISSTITTPEIIVGDPEEVMSELEGVDFLVVDSRRRDFSQFLRLARLSQRGAVLVCKNASGGKTGSWRAVVDDGRRVVRTAYLPVGEGIDMAHVASSGSSSSSSERRWIKHFDQSSGEEHVIRTR
ncbi:hypothetical protein RND81_06G234700 [Saponaria officinalis]|uniref:S-adenosyl-L-methionine-dependent methyltransferase n=1 Tax=Saponaria officinalis TaxID=3572 RepID=A0AAW1K9Z7_SAPOF